MFSESLFNDAFFLESLETYRSQYENGDKLALWQAIYWCGLFQAILPDWIVDAMEAVNVGIDSGYTKDFNEAFGMKRSDPRSRAKKQRIEKRQMDVTNAIYLATAGNRAVDNELIEEIGQRFGLTLRQTRECYAEGLKRFPKAQWRKPTPGEVVGTMNLKPKFPRRTGRPILRDAE